MTDKTYNPMSKEFQDECKKLGITGNELIRKYQIEGKYTEKNENYVRKIVPKIIHYNKSNTCDRCIDKGIETKIYVKRAYKEKNEIGDWTGRWLCNKCRMKDNNDKPDSHKNIIKSMRKIRTGIKNPNSSHILGNNSQKLACILYGWEDLNAKYDNYVVPIDCFNPTTELYHQVQGRSYSSIDRSWSFAHFNREQKKSYKNMVCICFSKDCKTVERIYIFPKEEEIDRVSGISIYMHSLAYGKGNSVAWYEKYRVIDKDELKRANDIWKEIIGEN